eukprot:TRINITY_DN4343_c0_g1_i6.p1 TRINITY_DN4343_c0_g1~~TRINITY_DN4343_c0_g1_i6.p1  ORF type:complete len:577 (-),score=115.34 TRINITY_DN4343_c0_g1_i6:120-1850(-)
MGPSGAGKTSLLNCISGQNQAHSGHVKLTTHDGKQLQWSKAMQRITAYVQQDDQILSTITPREHLLFQASLQMDQKLSEQQIQETVELMLKQLNLVKCADTPVGSPGLTRGISGGERKRLSFAAQLLGDPAILFVDEPTSGLDSHMAEEVVGILRQLASGIGSRSRTIITTIHQPTSHAFALFDQLLLLSEGRGVYLGPAADAVEHFAKFGPDLRCPQYMNPSDFFLHVLGVESFKAQRVALCDAYNEKWPMISKQDNDDHDGGQAAKQLALSEPKSASYTAGCGKQLKWLMWRELKSKLRSPQEIHANISMTFFFSLVMGLAYFQLGNTQTGVQGRNGSLFMVLIQMTFQQMTPTIMVFAVNLPMYMKEHKEGQYSLTSLFCSKMLMDIPAIIAIPLMFSLGFYFMLGLPANAPTYFGFVGVLAMTSCASSGVGYVLGIGAPNATVANMGLPMVLIPNMLLSGFMLNVDDIPVYLQPLQWLAFIKYGLAALYPAVWNDSEYDVIGCSNAEAAERECLFPSGDKVLAYYNIDKDGYMFNMLMLGVLSVGFRVIAFLLLRHRAKSFRTVVALSLIHI